MAASDDSNARRFLDAFNDIERVLRSRSRKKDGFQGFAELVRESKELISKQRDLLLDYAELRNAIVHNRTDQRGKAIADPRDDTVATIEQQLELIERPPILLDTLKLRPPRVLHARASIIEFFDDVRLPLNFSQAPVRDADGALALITTNAVARWVAESYLPGQGVALDDATIAEVLQHAEQGDRVEVRDRRLKVVEAWRIFNGEAGEPPAAILLTQSGKVAESPLGLCVRADLPVMLRALGV